MTDLKAQLRSYLEGTTPVMVDEIVSGRIPIGSPAPRRHHPALVALAAASVAVVLLGVPLLLGVLRESETAGTSTVPVPTSTATVSSSPTSTAGSSTTAGPTTTASSTPEPSIERISILGSVEARIVGAASGPDGAAVFAAWLPGTEGAGSLRLIRCFDAWCEEHEATDVLESVWSDPGPPAGHIAVLPDGSPVVALPSPDGVGTVVVTCADAACSSHATAQFPGTLGEVASVDVDGSGRPVLALRRTPSDGAGALVLVACGTRDCSSGNSTWEIGPVEEGIPRLVVDGRGSPIVAFSQWVGESATVAVCEMADCTGGPTIVRLTGAEASIAGLTIGPDGLPIVWYSTPVGEPGTTGPETMHAAVCTQPDCSSVDTITLPGSPEWDLPFWVHGDVVVLTGADGHPVVVRTEGRRIVVTHCSDARCASAQETDTGADVRDDEMAAPLVAITGPGGPLVAFEGPEGLSLLRCGDSTCALLEP